MAVRSRGVVLGPGEGETKEALGTTFTIKARGADTGGAYLAFEFTLQPGGGVPPHRHLNEDEALFVLEGEIESRVGDETVRSDPGSFQLIPRGTVHAQSNPGAAAAKALLIFSPPAFEGFLDEAPGVADEQLPALMAKYGMDLVD